VRAADIEYIPMARGFAYPVAIIDWYSRHVLACRLSNSLERTFCLEALQEALVGKTRILAHMCARGRHIACTLTNARVTQRAGIH
jgi:putative transposase